MTIDTHMPRPENLNIGRVFNQWVRGVFRIPFTVLAVMVVASIALLLFEVATSPLRFPDHLSWMSGVVQGVFLYAVIGVIVEGFITLCAQEAMAGRRSDAPAALATTLRRFSAVFFCSLPLMLSSTSIALIGIMPPQGIRPAIILVLLLFVFRVVFRVVTPVCLIENSSVLDAYRRAGELVDGNRWPIVLFDSLLLAISYGLHQAIVAASPAVTLWLVRVFENGAAADFPDQVYLGPHYFYAISFVGFMVVSLVMALRPLVVTAIYRELLIAKHETPIGQLSKTFE